MRSFVEFTASDEHRSVWIDSLRIGAVKEQARGCLIIVDGAAIEIDQSAQEVIWRLAALESLLDEKAAPRVQSETK